MKKKLALSLIMGLAAIALAVMLLLSRGVSTQPAPVLALPQLPEREPAWEAAALYTHGETLHVELFDEDGAVFMAEKLTLKSVEEDSDGVIRIIEHSYSGPLNRGLELFALPAGDHWLYYDELPLAPGAAVLPEGYTLPREGMRKHWAFAESDGRLLLSVEETALLPENVYDVFIDVGHGGEDVGAAGYGLVEAEENLRAGLYLAELLQEQGLKVRLSRETMDIPGGERAEKNPYYPGARLDSIYQSQAKYVISNHLNGGGGHGFQLYSSVKTDTAFAGAVAERLLEAGWIADDNGHDPLGGGLYKRRGETYSAELRDYYFIIRESGGYLLSPWQYRLQNRDQRQLPYAGAEALLVEYAFLDNYYDTQVWKDSWRSLVEAVAAGAADHWRLNGVSQL